MKIAGILLIIIGVLLFLGLFLIFPAIRRHPERSGFAGKYIAHRGLHGYIRNKDTGRTGLVPENSLEAFRLAIEKGYPIETDIHVTKDGRVAVFHDDTLTRMCAARGKPEDFTMEELSRMHLSDTRECIPSLEGLLELTAGRVPLLIEFKCTDKETCRRLCEAANPLLDEYNGSFAVQSFYPFVLSWYRRMRPEVMRGQLATAFYRDEPAKRLLGTLLINVIGRPDFVSYEHTHCRNFFFRLSTLLGALPLGWTFKNKNELEQARQYFRGYIFENEETVL